jgi:Flp pilus assembly protein TadD
MDLNDLGFRAINAGDYQEAVNIFKRALEKRDPEGLFGLGAAYQRLGEFKTARWAFYQALAIDAYHAKATAALNELEPAKSRRKPGAPASLYRAVSDYFEHYDHGQWTKIFMKAINIGLRPARLLPR